MATTFKLASYDYEDLRELSEKELRREYSRLRDVAHKRLVRLSQDPEFSKNETTIHYKNKFIGLKDIKKGQRSRLSKKLSELHKFLNLETSTVGGARKVSQRIIAGLQERGYKNIKTNDDLLKFGRYMDFNRALKDGGKYDSYRVQEMLGATDKAGISPKQVENDFDAWMKGYKNIKKAVPKIKGDARKGSTEWAELLLKLI